MRDYRQTAVIMGSGGGGKSQKAHTPVEAPNTLRASVKGRILDLIAYGPIHGLVDGLKSVYLDDTPVMNADDTLNFQGITIETREGYPDQTYMPGFPSVENAIEVGTEVLFDNPPVRSVSNNDADAVAVTVQLAALTSSQSNGDLEGYSVTVYIDLRSGQGSWQTVVSGTIAGKTTSPYPRTYRVELGGAGPYEIRVRRANKESSDSKINDKLTWTLMNEIIDSRLSYPNMALVGITVDSQLFGSSLPSRTYDLKLSIIKVPSNYNPDTREYTGIWDGSFKEAWTDNPAWCYYDLATHPIIGAGLEEVDKWAVYQIGRYCDEMVDDGYGGMEPRFTCNTIFAKDDDAISALNALATGFRGMSYWGTNTVVPVADMPRIPKKIVAPANTIEGEFDYAGSGIRERHSVAVVMWNDPKDKGKAVPEVYEDAESIEQFGWREVRVTAVACTSRGQARRLAKWILYSEREETNILSYSCALDQHDLQPGDIIQVADPDYQGARLAGRVIEPGSGIVRLDQLPSEAEMSVVSEWFLTVVLADGTMERLPVSSFSFPDNQVFLVGQFSKLPVVGAMWALSGVGISLPQFRVSSVKENDNSTYSITATEYDPNKYARVEQDLDLPEEPTSLYPTGPILAPLELSFEAYKYFAGNSEHQGLIISWTPAKDPRVTEYILDVQDPTKAGFRTVYTGAGLSYDLKDAMGGQWTVRVRAVASGIPSQWISRNVQIANLLMPVPPDSVQVTVKTFDITLWPVSAYPNAVYEFWRSEVPLSIGQIETNATQLATGSYLADTGLRAGRTYFYYIRGVNQYGVSTWFAAQGTTLEDFDDILDAVTEDIKNGQLYEVINTQITDISTSVATQVTEGLIDAAVADLQEQLDNLTNTLAYDPNLAYGAGDVVQHDRKLYQALKPVAAAPDGSNAPPIEGTWKEVGEILEEANGLATQVQQNTASIEEIGGEIVSQAAKLSAVQAAYRDDDSNGYLEGALKLWDTNAKVIEEVRTRATADEALAVRASLVEANVGDNTARITAEETARATADEAMGRSISEVRATTEDNAAAIAEEATARTTADSALATRVDQVTTRVGQAETSITEEVTARSDADSALGQRIEQVTTRVGQAETTITQEATARTTADEALGTRIDQVTTRVGNTEAAVSAESQARASETSALAQRIEQVQATAGIATFRQGSAPVATPQEPLRVGSIWYNTAEKNAIYRWSGTAWVASSDDRIVENTAAVQTVSNAVADVNGKLAASYAIKLQLTQDGRTYAAGMGLDIRTNGGITQSQILFQADRFAVINTSTGQVTVPFFIENNNVYINSAIIKDGSISFLKIGDNIQSDNYIAGQRGWKLSKAGGLEFNTLMQGGGKLTLTNEVIKVFDENGQVRVILGNLQA